MIVVRFFKSQTMISLASYDATDEPAQIVLVLCQSIISIRKLAAFVFRVSNFCNNPCWETSVDGLDVDESIR